MAAAKENFKILCSIKLEKEYNKDRRRNINCYGEAKTLLGLSLNTLDRKKPKSVFASP
jgi:hypothetical protein